MDLLHIYESVNQILNQIDFSALYPNFRKYRFAFYNRSEICFDGTLLPYDEIFLGNTSIEYQGEYIAIWNLDYENEVDAEILAYDMVHEMYHCFENENKEQRFPDDLKLLNYPSDLKNYMEKYQENKYLVNAFANNDEEAFQHFFEIRNARLAKHREYIQEEFKAETIEGMAEFVGLKALKTINEVKYQKILKGYLETLEKDIPLLFNIRRISYLAGAVFCLTMERFGKKIKNEFNELTVFEQNIIYPESSDDSVECSEVARVYFEMIKEKKNKIAVYIADKRYVEYRARICGYDPMNMFRVDDLIFCSHFIFLQNQNGCMKLDGPVLVKLKENSDNEIQGYY